MTSFSAPLRSRLPGWRICPLLLALTAVLLTAGPASAGLSLFWGKSFSPDTIGPGSVSILTFTITNNSSAGVRGVAFTDVLPAGVVLATPASPTIDCDGILSAPDGGSTISLNDGEVPGNGSCTITVAVTSSAIGTHNNRTGDLTSDAGNSGAATADLTVQEELPGFSKSFNPATVGLGGRSTLTFTIDNSLNEGGRDNLTFSDVLPAGLVIADPPNIVNTCGGGTITAVPGSDSISLIQSFPVSASVSAFQTCTLSVDVIAQSVGRLINLSGQLNSTLPQNFTEVPSGFASAALDVVISPLTFIKTFINDPVTPGSIVAVEYTIVNRSRDFEMTDISFTDDFEAALSGLATDILPAAGWCGEGSLLTGTSQFLLTGGRLAPEASCTFQLPLQVPANATPGAYPSTTSAITGIQNGSQVGGSPGTDTLFITVAPTLTKTFLENPATPGDSVTMRFSITNNSPSIASLINFVDELPPELSESITPPADGFCGANSTILVTPASQFNLASLSVSGAELGPGASCSFDVLVGVALGANTGTVTNTTEPIQATIADVLVNGNSASASLQIVSAPRLTKTFLDNPALPGQVARIEYTLTLGAESPLSATNIGFTDDLEAVIPGMVATNLPQSDLCGPGSTLTGTSLISFQGGSLSPGGTCSFVVDVMVPAQAPFGIVTNTTSAVTADVGGLAVMAGPAMADLLVTGLTFTKEFPDGPAIPGSTTTLRFTITNSGTVDATNIAFSDDLDDALPGLSGVQLPQSEICGPGSTLIGAGVPADSLLVFQGGRVPANSACSFDVTLQVPASALEGQYSSTTSNLSAEFDGNALALPPAAAALEVFQSVLTLTKTFDPNPVEVGGLTSLEFTLTNVHPTDSVRNVSFTDALPGGLSSVSGPLTGICGAGSQISGTTTLSFTGGLLDPGASCVFSVQVVVPPPTPTGTLLNSTSEVSGDIAGLTVRGDPATANVIISNPFRIRQVGLGLNGAVRVEWTATLGFRYCVQWSANLEDWNTVLPPIAAESELMQWTDPGPPVIPNVAGPVARRFYRIMLKAP